MKTLFIGGHHDGERLDVTVDGIVPATVTLNYSIGQEDYTLRHFRVGNTDFLFYTPTSWDDEDSVFALVNGYHGAWDAHTSTADIIEKQRIEIVRLSAQVAQMTDSKVREP